MVQDPLVVLLLDTQLFMNIPMYLLAQNVHGPRFTTPCFYAHIFVDYLTRNVFFLIVSPEHQEKTINLSHSLKSNLIILSIFVLLEKKFKDLCCAIIKIVSDS